ncbi:MAG: SDR family oxidoreductase [Chloroflexota bacterium]|nr:SDR family oxidoreductase [Chloroflexota bacterium]
MLMLQDKVVIVTGAAGGLGEGIARVCHREGAAVVIADVRAEAALAVERSLDGRALAIACDVRSDADLSRVVDDTVRHFGRIDGLVNNAGVNFVKPFLQTTTAEWDRVIEVDLRAVFLLTQAVCRRMLAQSPAGGSVVNISSVHSHAALPGAAPYDAAKWGTIGMGKSIAVELAPLNIRVNAVSPGVVDTHIWKDALAAAPDPAAVERHWFDNIPIGRAIQPAEIGELVAFLLSDRSACITGANIFADGGMSAQLVNRERWGRE